MAADSVGAGAAAVDDVGRGGRSRLIFSQVRSMVTEHLVRFICCAFHSVTSASVRSGVRRVEEAAEEALSRTTGTRASIWHPSRYFLCGGFFRYPVSGFEESITPEIPSAEECRDDMTKRRTKGNLKVDETHQLPDSRSAPRGARPSATPRQTACLSVGADDGLQV